VKRILITEDSPTMRSLLISTIEALGVYEIIEAGSGFEALRLLPRGKVDLIITDIRFSQIFISTESQPLFPVPLASFG